MKCPDHALCHVFEPITQVIVEVPCLLDLLVIALPVLFEKLVEGKEMMGIKTSGVKEPNRKSPRDTPVTVSEGVNRDEAVMGDSACYYGMQGFRPLRVYPFEEFKRKRFGLIRRRRRIYGNSTAFVKHRSLNIIPYFLSFHGFIPSLLSKALTRS